MPVLRFPSRHRHGSGDRATPADAHDFEGAPPGTGDLPLEAGATVRFSWQIALLRGTPEECRVAERYRTFAESTPAPEPKK